MTMRFIPTIDIFDGQAVLVKKGKVCQILGDPLKQAQHLSINSDFQVVDLNRAMGIGKDNKDIIKEICHRYTCYVAGGIRTYDDALEMLDSSAKRIVISTGLSKELLSKLSDNKNRIIVAFDIDSDGKIFTHGRKELTEDHIHEKIEEFEEYIDMVSVTFHDTEGSNEGIPINEVKNLLKFINLNNDKMRLIVAGGINTTDQIKTLLNMGVIPQFGTALWLNNFTLGDIYCAMLNRKKQENWIESKDGEILYPCAIRNQTGQMLGIVYTTEKTLKTSIDTRVPTFYSRDTGCKWTKGLTSGNTYHILNVSFSCDQTSLHFIVEPKHVKKRFFCHTGTVSCFKLRDPVLSGLHDIEEHLKLILETDNQHSYTKKIFSSKHMIYTKILEETNELWCAQTVSNVIWETADILYFIVLNLIKHGVQVKDVVDELTKRRFRIQKSIEPKADTDTDTNKKDFRLGICVGDYSEGIFEYLQRFGIVVKHNTIFGPRSLMYDGVFKNDPNKSLKVIPVKPKDVPLLMQNGFIDAIVSYKDIIENYQVDVVQIDTNDLKTDSKLLTKIVVVGNKDFNMEKVKTEGKKITILSEYIYLTSQWTNKLGLNAKILQVMGKSEAYLINRLCDLCVVVMQTGDTIRDNNLKVVDIIAESNVGFYVKPTLYEHVKSMLNRENENKDENKKNYYNKEIPTIIDFMLKNKTGINIDGNDGTGKTTVAEKLNKLLEPLISDNKIMIRERPIVTKLTTANYQSLPDNILDGNINIIFDASVEECRKRIVKRCILKGLPDNDPYETEDALFFYQKKFRYLAAKYGLYYIDTTNLTIDQVMVLVVDILMNHVKKTINNDHTIPCVDHLSQVDFDKLEKVIEGESKCVRKWDDRFHIIQYKPTIYSHKMQRAGVVDGSDFERMQMTQMVLDILWRNRLDHAYWYVGKQFILTKALDNKAYIPPIEVIVKRCFVGTDAKKYYYNLDKMINRFGQPMVKTLNGRNEYPHPIVRFDFRNPNYHPVTNEPIGDYAMSDSMANEFIDVEKAKPFALKVFHILMTHFQKFGVYLEDICLMITTDGQMLFGEISQDCGRYKQINEDKLSDLDKDVWRAGGSSALVMEKYKLMTQLIVNYVNGLYAKN